MSGKVPNIHNLILDWMRRTGGTYSEGAAYYSAHSKAVRAANTAARRRAAGIYPSRQPSTPKDTKAPKPANAPKGPKGGPQTELFGKKESWFDRMYKGSAAVGAGYLLGVRACGRDIADGVFDELIKHAEFVASTHPDRESMESMIHRVHGLVDDLRGNHAVKTASSADPALDDIFTKTAQAMQNMDSTTLLNKYLYKPVFGDSTAANIGTGVADIASYFTPYVGPARMGYDAIGDYVNMFGHDLSGGERARYLASALGNTMFAGMGLFGDAIIPGLGSGTTGLLRSGVKGLMRLFPGGDKAVKAVSPAVARATKAFDNSKLVQKQIALRNSMRASTNPATFPARYLSGVTPNPAAKSQGIIGRSWNKLPEVKVPMLGNVGGGRAVANPAASAGEAALNTAKYFGYGTPRLVAPMAGIMARPASEEFEAPPPPPQLNPLYTNTRRAVSPITS